MAETNGKTIWLWILIGCVAAVLLSRWSDSRKPIQPAEGVSSGATTARPTPAPSLLSDPSNQLELFDLTMVKSSAYRLSGDLRPIYIVSGRIKNATGFTVKDVQIQVHIIRKAGGLEVDSSRLTVGTPIPALETISFRQEIQIQPSQSAWEWTYEPIEAKIVPGP